MTPIAQTEPPPPRWKTFHPVVEACLSGGRQLRSMLLGLFLVAALLWTVIASRSGLWADELFSLAIATGHSLEQAAAVADPARGDFVEPSHAVPADEFRRYLQHENPPASPVRVIRAVRLSDTSPPLYYLLLEGWTLLFGTSDLALRLFSVSFSLVSLPLVAAVAQRIAGNGAALTSCALFAFSPLVAYYSTEGRMYSLLIFLALATAWVSLLLQERGARVSHCLLWTGLSVAGFLTHYFFLFPWLANVAFLLLLPRKLQRRWLLLNSLMTGVLILPWVWVAAGSSSSWRVTQGWLNWRPPGFHRMSALVDQFLQFFSCDSHGLWTTPRWSIALALAVFALAGGSAAWRLRWQFFTGSCLLLWLWFFAACAGPTAVDLLQHTYTAAIPRYALGGVPAACLLAGIAFACLGSRLNIALLGLVVLAWLPNARHIYWQRSRNFEPFREIARAVSNGSSSDLILIHSIPSGVLGVGRYVQTPALLASSVGQLRSRRVPESLPALVSGRTRVLFVKLVKPHEVGQPVPEEDWLRANAVVFQEKWMGAASVIEFRPKNAGTF